MDQAVERLVQRFNQVHSDKQEQQKFGKQMNDFLKLFNRFVASQKNQAQINWDRIRAPTEDHLKDYEHLSSDLDHSAIKNILSKLVVVKLNGGLGTTMGCTGPKSVIAVRGHDTFLDLTIKQIQVCNFTHLLISTATDHDCE